MEPLVSVGVPFGPGGMEQVFGNRYRVQEQVGSGGMATVYRGTDAVLKRQVAIKVLHPHLASRDDARRRFNREAQAIARLHHTNIVDVYDFSGQDDEQSYLITEFVHGQTLTEFTLAHGPFLPQSAALIGFAIAKALRHAHAQGIIHRDIKPDNLMISKAGALKLMDFGIATAMDLEQMTATGAILGSPAHMAPEQIDGAEIDARVDVFAFGTLLYYLVTRKLPFMASNPHALFRKILECNYEPPSRHNAAVGRRFQEIISTCMARDPEDRFSGMAAVQDALHSYLHDHKMSDEATLLQRLLSAPEQFELEWRPVLVQVLCEQGHEQSRTGSLALAIDAYNRALAIDPTAVEPKRGLSELTSRSRRNRRVRLAARAVGAVVALVAAGFGVKAGLQRWQAPPVLVTPADSVHVAFPGAPKPGQMRPDKQVPPPPPPTGANVVPQGPPATVAATEPANEPADEPADEPDRVAQPHTRRPTRARKPPPEPVGQMGAGPKQASPPVEAAGTKVLVRLGSSPPNWDLYLDGQFIGNGHVRRWLVIGKRYRLTCKSPPTCMDCPEMLSAPVAPVAVGGAGGNHFKCVYDAGRGPASPG